MREGNLKTFPVYLEGRITSDNAADWLGKIQAEMAAHPGEVPELDAEKLAYLSSAGLRVLLNLRKAAGKLTIRNVSPEIYEIFETTGFDTLMHVEKKLRQISVEGCEVIGKGTYGMVYRLDEDRVVKVYPSAEWLPKMRLDQERARKAFIRGVPTAIPYDIVRVGERYGAIYEMVKAKSCNEELIAHPETFPDMMRMYARFLQSVHQVEMKEGELPDSRGVFLSYLEAIAAELPEKTAGRLRALVETVPESLHVIHGDAHLQNIMLSDREWLLIDMDTISAGDPVFEFGPLFMTYRLFIEEVPEDALAFHGLDAEICRRIFRESLEQYLGGGEEACREAEEKAAVVGLIRFLYELLVLQEGRNPYHERYMAYALDRLAAVLPRVESLAFGGSAGIH